MGAKFTVPLLFKSAMRVLDEAWMSSSTNTVTSACVPVHAPRYGRTVYVVVVVGETVIEGVRSPVLQMRLGPPLAFKTTVSPLHTVMSGSTVAVGVVTVTAVYSVSLHPTALDTIT